MRKHRGVNYFFLFCTSLFVVGQLHQFLNQPTEKEPSPTPARAVPTASIFVTKKSTEFIFPVPGKSQEHLIGRFGEPRGGGTRKHEGIDIMAKRGTPVVAVTDGTVTRVKEGGNGGKQVWMEDEAGELLFYYAHLHTQSVEVDQEVEQGDELGTIGNTGNARGGSPHLHFSIYEPGMQAIDPLTMLP